MNGWKVTALILLTIFGLFIALGIWSFSFNEDIEQNNINCWKFCGEQGAYNYTFDYDNCYCYIENQTIKMPIVLLK